MQVDKFIADTLIRATITVLEQGGTELDQTLDTLPVPIYVADADGVITYFNRACVAFAGRTPEVGNDSWCVTWRLYAEGGAFLPHDQCPMAVAIREGRAVRDVVAFAERPDGSRARFMPYPTPFFDESGAIAGAVNLFINASD